MRCTDKGVYAKSNEMARRRGTISPGAASLFSQSSSRATYICPDSEDDTDDELYPPDVDVDVPRHRADSPGEETQGSTTPEDTGGGIRTPSPHADVTARRAATSDTAVSRPVGGASPAGELLFSDRGP